MKNPWKKLMQNVKLSGEYGCFGGSSRNPKNREDKEKKGSQSTKRHAIHITWEDLKKKFEEQDGKCFWFGIPINPDWVFKPHFVMAPSVDRLDNEKEYTYDNIVITCRFANVGRRNTHAKQFAKMIAALSKHGIKPNFDKMHETIEKSLLSTKQEA